MNAAFETADVIVWATVSGALNVTPVPPAPAVPDARDGRRLQRGAGADVDLAAGREVDVRPADASHVDGCVTHDRGRVERRRDRRDVRAAVVGERERDVALAVDRWAAEPAVVVVGRVRAVLVEVRVAAAVDAHLVPALPTLAGLRSDRVQHHDRLEPVAVAVDDAVHELVALGVEPRGAARLRHALRELAVAEEVVGRHGDLRRTGESRLGRVVEVDVELVAVDTVILEDAAQLIAAGGEEVLGLRGRREALAVEVGGLHEADRGDDDALLGGIEAPQHARPVDGTGVLLDHVVARAGGVVVGVRPDGHARVVGEQRAAEDVAVEGAGRVGADADGVAHGIEPADA
jgi:hypothetical protein